LKFDLLTLNSKTLNSSLSQNASILVNLIKIYRVNNVWDACTDSRTGQKYNAYSALTGAEAYKCRIWKIEKNNGTEKGKEKPKRTV